MTGSELLPTLCPSVSGLRKHILINDSITTLLKWLTPFSSFPRWLLCICTRCFEKTSLRILHMHEVICQLWPFLDFFWLLPVVDRKHFQGCSRQFEDNKQEAWAQTVKHTLKTVIWKHWSVRFHRLLQHNSQPSKNAESFKTGMLTWRRSAGSSWGTSARARQRALLWECAPAAWQFQQGARQSDANPGKTPVMGSMKL